MAAATVLGLDPASPRGAAELQWQLRVAAAAAAAAAVAPQAAVHVGHHTTRSFEGMPLPQVLLLAAKHVEVRRADPQAWTLLAAVLAGFAAAAAARPAGGDGDSCAAWWHGVRDWWVEACFRDPAAPASGSVEDLRQERVRAAHALRTALVADNDPRLLQEAADQEDPQKAEEWAW